MKILEIKNGNGFFWKPAESKWIAIDEIDKESLMKLLDILLEQDIEMDMFDESMISNQAHLIIYRSIFEKFQSLENNKSKFKDESDRMYLSAIQKYSQT